MLFLLFQIGNDRYAIEAQQAIEVLPLVELKRIPQSARGVAGIFNYRGRPVPAIDLSELTTGQPARECLSTRIIIVQQTDPAGRGQLIGLIAERATELLRRESKELVTPGDRTGDVGQVTCDEKKSSLLTPPVTSHASPFGPVLMDAKGLVQLIHPQRLLPGELRSALFEQVAELVDERN